MRFLKLLVGLIVFGVASGAGAESRINVPSDPSAKYFVIELKKISNGIFEIATRREGTSGTSFAARRVTCNPLMSAYVAEGDNLSDLVNRETNPTMRPLFAGSISDVVSRYACSNG